MSIFSPEDLKTKLKGLVHYFFNLYRLFTAVLSSKKHVGLTIL
jgi:hypothetical protein